MGSFVIGAIVEHGVPHKLRTDCGTENVDMERYAALLRDAGYKIVYIKGPSCVGAQFPCVSRTAALTALSSCFAGRGTSASRCATFACALSYCDDTHLTCVLPPCAIIPPPPTAALVGRPLPLHRAHRRCTTGPGAPRRAALLARRAPHGSAPHRAAVREPRVRARPQRVEQPLCVDSRHEVLA